MSAINPLQRINLLGASGSGKTMLGLAGPSKGAGLLRLEGPLSTAEQLAQIQAALDG
ncbi:MAG: hypothetical protein ACO1RX_20705 [Candidatus Sericytochromatia bacterium]